jgi:Tol biopolymer transport system component
MPILTIAGALLVAPPAGAASRGTARELAAAGTETCLAKDCSIVPVHGVGPFLQVIEPRTRATRFLPYCWDYECSAPAWSADGRYLAVAVGTGSMRWPDGELRTVNQLAILDAGGRLVRMLPLQTPSDNGPVWSPDGRQLAFLGLVSVTPAGDRYELYTVNADGTGLVRRSAAGQDVRGVAWSSTGRLAFSNVARLSGIYLVEPGRPPRRIIRRARGFDWSPVGTRIVATDLPRLGVGGVSVNTALSVFDTRGRRTRIIRLIGRPIGKTGVRVTSVGGPAWSPDGRRIAFVTRGPGEIATWVVVADASNGGRVERVFGRTQTRADYLEWVYESPAWRPAPKNKPAPPS